MAKLEDKSILSIEAVIILQVNEVELRALEVLCTYDVIKLVKYDEEFGKGFLKVYIEGIQSLFESIRVQGRPILDRIDSVREEWSGGE